MSEKRSSFTSKIGFVLAAAGSAVGLGNLWRFPYLAAKYGGGMFILIYIILALTFGFALMIAEIALGRKTGQSAINAYAKLNKNCAFFGIINSLVPIIITPYYCVIGGWVLKFLWSYITMPAAAVAATNEAGLTLFEQLITSTTSPILWFLLFLLFTIMVILIGVDKGIEKCSTFLMPILVLLVAIVAIYACTLPGAFDGVKYLIKPNLKDFSAITVLAAMTQLFFSLSLAMGIMITYGSYMKKNTDIETSTWQIEAFDTGVAFLAALAIIPAIFAVGDPSNLKAGPSLMFIILPQLFAIMPFGRVIAILFFFLVFFAAITSSISLYETVVSIVCDKAKAKRNTGIIVTFFICLVIGLLSSLGYGPLNNVTIIGMQFLDLFDFLSNNVLMPIAALCTCIFVGFIIKPKAIIEEVELSGKFRWKKLFTIVIKYVAPIIIIIILITSILQGLGVLKV